MLRLGFPGLNQKPELRLNHRCNRGAENGRDPGEAGKNVNSQVSRLKSQVSSLSEA